MSPQQIPTSIPKTLGADIELGNSLRTAENRSRSNREAADRLLRPLSTIPQFHGVFHFGPRGTERDRHWLRNGGCIYIDMDHLELATPETASAFDHAAAVHAMLRIARGCYRKASLNLPPGCELFVNGHVSDSTWETSWGAHLNVAVSRELFDSLMHTKPHRMALLASYFAAAISVFGQGLVLKIAGEYRYLTSARIHHLGQLAALTTTEHFRRPLVNTRDEPHTNFKSDIARLHIIAFDTNLQPASIVMRSGLTQLVLAALEQGWWAPHLVMDDPLKTARRWATSFQPQRGTLVPPQQPMATGSTLDLFQWHALLVNDLRELWAAGAIGPCHVPDGDKILDMWDETLEWLREGQTDRLASRLDWALKWQILDSLLTSVDDLSDPNLRMIDQLYSHIDDQVGLFWSCWRDGLVDRVFSDRQLQHFMDHGDPHTRSGQRSELVRRLGPWISKIDWSYVDLSESTNSWWRPQPAVRVELPRPGRPLDDYGLDRFAGDYELLQHLLRPDSHQQTPLT